MATRWYESRTNQAALIGAAAVIVVAIVSAVASVLSRPAYPTLEVKDLSPSGEQVLARLALSPARQLVDSSAFAELADQRTLWNDSIGVAVALPRNHEWGVVEQEVLQDVSASDIALVRMYREMTKRGFGDVRAADRIRYFGVRLDKPTTVLLDRDAVLDSSALGQNLYRNSAFFISSMRMLIGDDVLNIPLDTLAQLQVDAITHMDSVIASYLPSERRIANGVFVARIDDAVLQMKSQELWLRRPRLDLLASEIGVSTGAPTLFVLDRDRGTFLFSDVVRISNITLNGEKSKSVTLNRAGYAIERGEALYLVLLQYTSDQPPAVLQELERLLSSVRLRAGPA